MKTVLSNLPQWVSILPTLNVNDFAEGPLRRIASYRPGSPRSFNRVVIPLLTFT